MAYTIAFLFPSKWNKGTYDLSNFKSLHNTAVHFRHLYICSSGNKVTLWLASHQIKVLRAKFLLLIFELPLETASKWGKARDTLCVPLETRPPDNVRAALEKPLRFEATGRPSCPTWTRICTVYPT